MLSALGTAEELNSEIQRRRIMKCSRRHKTEQDEESTAVKELSSMPQMSTSLNPDKSNSQMTSLSRHLIQGAFPVHRTTSGSTSCESSTFMDTRGYSSSASMDEPSTVVNRQLCPISESHLEVVADEECD